MAQVATIFCEIPDRSDVSKPILCLISHVLQGPDFSVCYSNDFLVASKNAK